jgi:transposase
LRHRYKLVCFRISVKNQLHALAMSQGVCRKKKLFTAQGREELEKVSLGPRARRRCQELLGMLDQLNSVIEELDRAAQQQAEGHAGAARLMTHPGVGPVTALAFVLTLGPVARFRRSKHAVSYLGLNPKERSSGG